MKIPPLIAIGATCMAAICASVAWLAPSALWIAGATAYFLWRPS